MLRYFLLIFMLIFSCSLATSTNDYYHSFAEFSKFPTNISYGRATNQISDLGHEKPNCTPSTIHDFPPDMFTQQQRQQGGVVVHFILSIYTMLMIGIVVDVYFVPTLEIIGKVLNMSPNVAGATIMAIGTSSPELFTNLVGTFVTKGDIGVGTIIGSGAFNILFAPGLCGVLAGLVVDLEWWPLTRDCIIYGFLVIGLVVAMSDGLIFWWEAMIFVISYLLFLIVMFLNQPMERVANRFVDWVRNLCGKSRVSDNHGQTSTSKTILEVSTVELELDTAKSSPQLDSETVQNNEADTNSEDENDGPVKLFEWPQGTVWQKLYWCLMWPGNFLFFITIPNIREPKLKKLYPVTFIICVLWIGSLTYLVTWFITVIGYTFGVPDSAMGITFLAAGGSIPEAVATIVVARQGKGSMGISNSVGSNSFDIMICMGLPWLIGSLTSPKYPEEGNFVAINSGGVVYSVLMLFCTILLLYFAIAINKFRLDRKVGAILLFFYLVFLVIASMLELNVFFYVNPPECPDE